MRCMFRITRLNLPPSETISLGDGKGSGSAYLTRASTRCVLHYPNRSASVTHCIAAVRRWEQQSLSRTNLKRRDESEESAREHCPRDAEPSRMKRRTLEPASESQQAEETRATQTNHEISKHVFLLLSVVSAPLGDGCQCKPHAAAKAANAIPTMTSAPKAPTSLNLLCVMHSAFSPLGDGR